MWRTIRKSWWKLITLFYFFFNRIIFARLRACVCVCVSKVKKKILLLFILLPLTYIFVCLCKARAPPFVCENREFSLTVTRTPHRFPALHTTHTTTTHNSPAPRQDISSHTLLFFEWRRLLTYIHVVLTLACVSPKRSTVHTPIIPKYISPLYTEVYTLLTLLLHYTTGE